MANLRVSLLRYIKSAQKGWRRVRVEAVPKGRGWNKDWDSPRTYGPDCEEVGPYQLKWYTTGGKAQYVGVGNDLREAITAQEAKQALLRAENAADEAGVKLVTEAPDRKTLLAQKAAFIRLKELSNRDKETISAYDNLIGEFLSVSGKLYADQLVETDLLQFCDGLRKRGLSERTTMNYYSSITAFLNYVGVDHKKIVAKEHRPHQTDPDPEAYTEEEARKFLDALTNEKHRLFFEFLLKSGCREKEATHLEWTDLDWDESCVNIQGKKSLNLIVKGEQKHILFQTKTKRARSIPLEAGILEKLRHWQRKNPTTRFLFGSRSDFPDNHYLETCKQTAFRAGLNCGVCDSCSRTKGKECERWFLHKFRASFATWSLRRGVDIRTVQAWLGHTDVAMTSRYLAPAKGRAAQDRINAVFANF